MHWQAIEMAAGRAGVLRYQLHVGGQPMSWSDVMHGWADGAGFVDFFADLLAQVPFDAFRWETPGLVERDLDKTFEFVAVQADKLVTTPDRATFAGYCSEPGQVETFKNLSGDATLLVPCPLAGNDDFAHIAAFLRTASPAQIQAFWQCVAAAVSQRVGSAPMWLSTAGDGVAWLHMRLDDYPKYYAYSPYRDTAADGQLR